MAQIEQRLLAAEAAAQQAKDAVVGQADVAKLERERALAARAEAEQANKNLDSARYLANLCFDQCMHAAVQSDSNAHCWACTCCLLLNPDCGVLFILWQKL